MMNLASIDIGSNGARLLIKRFDPEAIREEDRIKKLMFIRIPLRLGKDVFTLGKVSKEREKMMLHMMKGFKQFMKLNDVEAFRACATSAMRDAENGKKVLKKIEKQTGIKLEIIKGQEEAQLLYIAEGAVGVEEEHPVIAAVLRRDHRHQAVGPDGEMPLAERPRQRRKSRFGHAAVQVVQDQEVVSRTVHLVKLHRLTSQVLP